MAHAYPPRVEKDDDGEIEDPNTPNNEDRRILINNIWMKLPQRNKKFCQKQAIILNQILVVGLVVSLYPFMDNNFIKNCIRNDWIEIWKIM